MNSLINIQITEVDAQVFILFQKHYVAFKMLDSIGAFNTKTASVTLHFAQNGQIKSIEKNETFRPELSTFDSNSK